MTDEEKDTVTHRRKSLEIYYEFQWRSLVQTVELLAKGVTYYITILTAIGGYIFIAKLLPEEKKPLIIVSVIVSILFGFIIIAIGYGILKGISQMEDTLAKYNTEIFLDVSMMTYFKRGKLVGLLMVACCILILTTIAGALAVKFYI